MANQLADLVSAQNSGYESGKGQASPNALGLFIRTMLAQRQKNLDLQQEIGAKKELLQTEYNIKSNSPLGIAELSKTQAESGLKSQEFKLKEEAKTKYDAGDRSPEVLKALDMYSTPNIFNLMDGNGMSSMSEVSTNPLSTNSSTATPPIPASLKYNRNTQQPQYNKRTGQWRVVPK